MKHSNDFAMAIGAIAFGVFCLFVVVAGIIYVVALTSSQPAYTNTYGNTIGDTGNQSQDLVETTTDSSGPAFVALFLIGGVVLLIAVLVAIWIFSKTGISI